MAEKRNFCSVICVKTSAKSTVKIELFPSEQWEDGETGRYRLRIDRKWHDHPDGGNAYLDLVQIGTLAASLAVGMPQALAPEPDLPSGSSVSVPNGRILCGQVQRDVTRTTTPPILAYDGRWYAGVLMWRRGTVMKPVDELIRR